MIHWHDHDVKLEDLVHVMHVKVFPNYHVPRVEAALQATFQLPYVGVGCCSK